MGNNAAGYRRETDHSRVKPPLLFPVYRGNQTGYIDQHGALAIPFRTGRYGQEFSEGSPRLRHVPGCLPGCPFSTASMVTLMNGEISLPGHALNLLRLFPKVSPLSIWEEK